jgi:transcriptional antiterminator RfaH
MKRWYVVSTQTRSEEKAAFHLRRQGYEVYLPKYLKRRNHARRIDWHPAPLFPRYLFVSVDVEHEPWRSIRSTLGVSHLIGNAECPVPVPEGIVEKVRAQEDDEGIVKLTTQSGLKAGDKVQVIYGAFADHIGIFECADDKQRVFILLDLLGRAVKVSVPLESVAAGA